MYWRRRRLLEVVAMVLCLQREGVSSSLPSLRCGRGVAFGRSVRGRRVRPVWSAISSFIPYTIVSCTQKTNISGQNDNLLSPIVLSLPLTASCLHRPASASPLVVVGSIVTSLQYNDNPKQRLRRFRLYQRRRRR